MARSGFVAFRSKMVGSVRHSRRSRRGGTTCTAAHMDSQALCESSLGGLLPTPGREGAPERSSFERCAAPSMHARCTRVAHGIIGRAVVGGQAAAMLMPTSRTTCIIIEPRACWTSVGRPFKPPGPGIPNASKLGITDGNGQETGTHTPAGSQPVRKVGNHGRKRREQDTHARRLTTSQSPTTPSQSPTRHPHPPIPTPNPTGAPGSQVPNAGDGLQSRAMCT